MLQYLLDTDHVTLFELGHAQLGARIGTQLPGSVGVAAVTVEESLRGRLAQVGKSRDGPERIARYRLLVATVQLFQTFPILAYDQSAEDHFQSLLTLRPRVGSQDLKIAGVALANKLTLVTRNKKDFSRIPNLPLDDWST